MEIKFKVGDVITNGRDIVTITGISSRGYDITSEEIEYEDAYSDSCWYIPLSNQNNWKLANS